MKNRILLFPVFAAGIVVLGLVISRPKSGDEMTHEHATPMPQAPTTVVPESKTPGKVNSKSVAWAPAFEAAMARAKATNSIVMIDFHATWCGPCHMMDEQTYPDVRVIAASRRFISVQVDVDKRPDVAAQYGIQSLPTVMWIRPNGKPIAAVAGFVAPEEFAQLMKKAHLKSLAG